MLNASKENYQGYRSRQLQVKTIINVTLYPAVARIDNYSSIISKQNFIFKDIKYSTPTTLITFMDEKNLPISKEITGFHRQKWVLCVGQDIRWACNNSSFSNRFYPSMERIVVNILKTVPVTEHIKVTRQYGE